MQRTAAFLGIFFALAGVDAMAQDFMQLAAYQQSSTGISNAGAPGGITTLAQLLAGTHGGQRMRSAIGFTKGERPVTAYYFPGRSSGRALVIGGVHGTELSSIEVAHTLVRQLAAGDTPFYNVLIIPSLFPDNAIAAAQQQAEIGSTKNIGRYSSTHAPDPNRQMPALGQPYNAAANTDALGRPIEFENALLLQLIQAYRPHRIVSIHAIRDTAHSGVYADPRADGAGFALDYRSDSSLAVRMARHIESGGGRAPGNRLDSIPSALYYKDPQVAPPGQWQKRSCHSAARPGVSLGSWAATAVIDAVDTTNNRPAIQMLTMEFPGCKRPQDYHTAQRPFAALQVRLYALAIQAVFLEISFSDAAAME